MPSANGMTSSREYKVTRRAQHDLDKGMRWDRRYSSIICAPINPRGQPVIGRRILSQRRFGISPRCERYVFAYEIRHSRGGLISPDEDLLAAHEGYFRIKPLVTSLSILKRTVSLILQNSAIFDILDSISLRNICFPMKMS